MQFMAWWLAGNDDMMMMMITAFIVISERIIVYVQRWAMVTVARSCLHVNVTMLSLLSVKFYVTCLKYAGSLNWSSLGLLVMWFAFSTLSQYVRHSLSLRFVICFLSLHDENILWSSVILLKISLACSLFFVPFFYFQLLLFFHFFHLWFLSLLYLFLEFFCYSTYQEH